MHLQQFLMLSVRLVLLTSLSACCEAMPEKSHYAAVFDRLGQTKNKIEAIRARRKLTTDPSTYEVRSGRDLVLACATRYNPATGGTTADEAWRFFEPYEYTYGLPAVSDHYTVAQIDTSQFLFSVCHTVKILADHAVPWDQPTEEQLDIMFWTSQIHGDTPDWLTALPDQQHIYKPAGLDMLDSGAESWRIGQKFIGSSTTRHAVVLEVIRWFKAYTYNNGFGRLASSFNSEFEIHMTYRSGENTLEMAQAMRTVFQALLIPAIVLKRDPKNWDSQAYLWLPGENAVIYPKSLFEYPALAAQQCLMPWSVIAEEGLPFAYLFGNLGGPKAPRTGMQIYGLVQNDNFFLSYVTGVKPSELTPDDLSIIAADFGPYLRKSEDRFVPIPNPTYALLLDPAFPLR